MGGIVFRVGDEHFFLPATVAVKVLPLPEIARVPGAPPALVGVALVDGEPVPVVAIDVARAHAGAQAIGASRAAMLVCLHVGERIALVGLEIVRTGDFPADGHGADEVVVDGARARLFDLAAVVSQMREGRWAV